MGAVKVDHRAASIQFLRSTGLIPVRIRPNEKSAYSDWEPRRAASEDHAEVIRALENDATQNLAALFSGRYADIDIDTGDPALIAALDAFLPRTMFVWGRQSKPRSHRAYALHEDFDRAPLGRVLKYCKELQLGDVNLSVEIRGGTPENGLYSVLPGSTHPSGEKYEWADKIDPTASGAYVDLDTLVRSVRLAQAAAVIVPFWVEGVRNDMSLALSGLLWRIRSSSIAAYGMESEKDDDGFHFLLTEDVAKRFMGTVMTIAGDDPVDQRSRLLNFKNTWDKLDRDPTAKVTGGRSLAEQMGEGGPDRVRALYRLLSDSTDLEQIDQLIERFVVWHGPGVCIDLDMVAKGHTQPWMSKDQTVNSLGGQKITVGDKRIPIANMIFGSNVIRRVQGITFDPSTTELMVDSPMGVMVNQWRGFGTEPCSQMVTDEEVEPYLSYVREVIAAGEEDRERWIHAWTADLFQKPHDKPGTALVLIGPQGAGKTFMGEQVLGAIIGDSHYVQLNSIDGLTSKFNNIATNRILIHCDEATHNYQRDTAAKLKSVITDRSLTIEPKGINSYKAPNHTHILFTSNEDNAVFIDPSPFERRYTVYKVSPIRAQDTDYWVEMRAWTKANLPKILRWMLDYKYDRDLILRPLMTQAKRDIQRASVDMEVAWAVTRVNQGFPLMQKFHTRWFDAFHTAHMDEKERQDNVLRRDIWPNRITSAALEADFKEFARSQGRTIWGGSIVTSLLKALPEGSLKDAEHLAVKFFSQSGKVVERVRTMEFPPTQAIIAHLREKYGDVVDHNFVVNPDEPLPLASDEEDEESEY